MKQILLCVTIATATASSTLAAHAATVSKTIQSTLSPQNIQQELHHSGSVSVVGSNQKNGLRPLNPQPLPPRW
jgi:long-subunit acyl-CoA synthetase (AMP-forming)